MKLDRPLALWDGDCGFCRMWVVHWQQLTRGRVDFEAFQGQAQVLQAFDLDELEAAEAIHLLMPDGSVLRGAAAVFEILRASGAGRHALLAHAYRRLPGFSDVSEAVYRKVRHHRSAAATATRWLWGRPQVETFRVSQLSFGRLLALASFLAFWSLAGQVDGLYGADGILPISDFLERAATWGAQTGRDAATVFPGIFWLDASDAALAGAATAGMVFSVMLFLGVAPRLFVPLLWLLYLSFVSAGQIFMGYQWDGLLLEALFVGWFFVPWKPWLTLAPAPLPAGRWLIWLLTAKLMFLAGLVKIRSDEVWRDLSALDFHFWTQPIPNAVAWYADQLPSAVKSLGVLFTLGAETAAPLLVFAPRRLRHAGALVMIALQLAIMATGTYGFFNLLTIALCVTLFDDGFFRTRPIALPTARPAMFAMILLVAGPLVGGTAFLPYAVRRTLEPLRTFNRYGLFASMTRERPEVAVEWSPDGNSWVEYDFEYKPTAPDEPLRPTTFLMPRLDWQMWFAALGRCEDSPWLLPFAERLLRGSPAVEGLLGGGVPAQAPKFIRMRYHDYRFGNETPWVRTGRGTFCPTFTVGDTGLEIVDAGD